MATSWNVWKWLQAWNLTISLAISMLVTDFGDRRKSYRRFWRQDFGDKAKKSPVYWPGHQYLKMSPIFLCSILQPEPKVNSLLQHTITRLFIDSCKTECSKHRSLNRFCFWIAGNLFVGSLVFDYQWFLIDDLVSWAFPLSLKLFHNSNSQPTIIYNF